MVGSLRRCEALAAQLFAEQGRLAQAAIGAESAMGLSAVATQAVLNEMAEASHRTAGVRAHLVATHRRLEQLGGRLDIDMSQFGDTGKTPGGNGFFTTGADTLQVAG